MLDAIPATIRSSMLPCAMRPIPEVVVVEPPALRRRGRPSRAPARHARVASVSVSVPGHGGWYASAVLAALLAVVWMHTPQPAPNRSRGVPAERYRHGAVVDRGLATVAISQDAA